MLLAVIVDPLIVQDEASVFADLKNFAAIRSHNLPLFICTDSHFRRIHKTPEANHLNKQDDVIAAPFTSVGIANY